MVHTHISSETGLSSVTSIVIGSKSTIIIDPPSLIPDALSVAEQTEPLTSNPVVAVFVTHHLPTITPAQIPSSKRVQKLSSMLRRMYVPGLTAISWNYTLDQRFWPRERARKPAKA